MIDEQGMSRTNWRPVCTQRSIWGQASESRWLNRLQVTRLIAAVWIGIVVLTATHVDARSVAAAEHSVASSARRVPVIARVDLVVVGGNEGAVAAAWKAASLGASAIVVNGNYFFSDDVSAKARYWLEEDEQPRGEFAKALFAGPADRPLQLVPAQYKRRIEAMLLEAGVSFHFNSQPAGVLVDDSGEVAGVLTANKAGLQAIVAKVVIDATPTAALARMAGAKASPWAADRVRVSRISYARHVPGSRQLGDFYEYWVEAPLPSGSWPERCHAEVLLREKFNRVVASKAHAHRMHVIEPSAIQTGTVEDGPDWPGGDKLSLECCVPEDVDHVYVLSQSAGISRALAEKLTRPVHLANLGERIGARAHRDAQQRAMPEGVVVKPVAGRNQLAGADVSELLHGHRRHFRDEPQRVLQPETSIPLWAAYDVVVVGGGTAGIPAAIGAASNGAKVLVIEMLGQLGGNRELGTPGYWKGYRHGFNRNDWRAAESFAELRKAGVDIWYNTLCSGAVKEGNRVRGVVVATPMGRGAVLAKIVVDATGDADVCAAAGARFHYVNDGDLCIQEASYRGLGLYANALPIDHADVHSLTMHHVMSRKAGKQEVWDFYPMVGIRETRLVQGDYVVNVLDQILGRTYADLITVAQSAYDPHGYHNSDLVYAGLMPLTKHETKPGFITYLPFRSLLPAGLKGILVVGRSHSVTHDVQASVRMNPDLINEGYAAGYTAAQAIKTGQPLRQVDLAPIQDHLAEIGNISAEDRRTKCVDMPDPTDAELKAAANDPATKENLAKLLLCGKRSIPLLKASFASTPSLPKAKGLAALGDRSSGEYLINWLKENPLGEGITYDWEGFLHVPEVESVIWMLGTTRDQRAVPALVEKLQQCGSKQDSFSQIRALTTALGRIGSPEAADSLYAFLRRDGVQGHVDVAGNPDSVHAESFVKSYIELHAAGALYRGGDRDGLGRKILTDYLDDWRGIFVRYAGHVLTEQGNSTRQAG